LALAFVTDNDWFALVSLLMQDCCSNDRRHSCRICINVKSREPVINLLGTAAPKPLLIEYYLKKSKTGDKKNYWMKKE